jgi:hypothetical protein
MAVQRVEISSTSDCCDEPNEPMEEAIGRECHAVVLKDRQFLPPNLSAAHSDVG